MPAKDLGNKFTCFKCGSKFYDMKKPDPLCPKCGVDQRDNVVTKPTEGRRSRLAAQPKVIEPEPEEREASEEEELEGFEEEEGEAAPEEDEEI